MVNEKTIVSQSKVSNVIAEIIIKRELVKIKVKSAIKYNEVNQ